MASTPTNPATIALRAVGLSIPQFADLIGVSRGAARKIVDGERRINATHAQCLVDTFGDDGQAIVDATQTRYRERRPRHDFKPVLFDMDDYAVAPVEYESWVRCDGTVVWMLPDDPNDTETYTITEWKSRFGQPGAAADRHGRMFGYFTTEPDYCE